MVFTSPSLICVKNFVLTRLGFECLTGAWSEWGSCQAPEVRPGHSRDVKGVVKEVDDGREAMSELMKMKQEAFAQPNLRTPTSQVDGPVECVDGKSQVDGPVECVDRKSQVDGPVECVDGK